MHKIFAKPLFLGKKVVFLPQCHSTNEELSQMVKKAALPEGTVMFTDHQISGKGQRGNIWAAEPSKNVLMSLLLRPNKLPISNQFYLNLVISLAVLDTLRVYSKSRCQLKWPNDVYLNDSKVCGILIENSLKGTSIDYSIVGIGLNLNQKGFNIQKATSIYLETGKGYQVEEAIDQLLLYIEQWYLRLNSGKYVEILEAYHEQLMWKDELHEFQANEEIFKGTIKGIDNSGRLIIEKLNGAFTRFNVKEVSFIS